MGKNIVKALTKANIKAYGIERAPQYDFNDDGNRFKGFIYKGMPMTQCYAKSYGEVYLTIRPDYLKNNFTFKEWSETEEFVLEDEFNGVSEIDMDKLVANLERVIAKRDELNSSTSIDPEDIKALVESISEEINFLKGFINTIKIGLPWWKFDGYKLTSAAEYVRTLSSKMEYGEKIVNELSSFSTVQIKTLIEGMKAGRRKILSYEFYVSELEKLMAC